MPTYPWYVYTTAASVAYRIWRRKPHQRKPAREPNARGPVNAPRWSPADLLELPEMPARNITTIKRSRRGLRKNPCTACFRRR